MNPNEFDSDEQRAAHIAGLYVELKRNRELGDDENAALVERELVRLGENVDVQKRPRRTTNREER